MSATYRLFGAETSAFSIKLRSFMRYKGLEHEWLVRTHETEETLQDVSRFATLPVLVTSTGFAVHDTTPTLEALEADRPDPQSVPADRGVAFLSAALEDYADLWLTKAVMQYRWGRKKDQKEAATRAIDEYFAGQEPEGDRKQMIKSSIERMETQFPRLGLNKEVGAIVEKSFKRFVKLLNAHLEGRDFIFGGRPSFADFGISAQLIQLLKDPTPSKILHKEGPNVVAWCERMDSPQASGDFATLEELAPTLAPIFKKELAVTFLPWAAANLESSLARSDEVTVTLGKEVVVHEPLRSAARSFKDTRRKFSVLDDEEALSAFLDSVGVTEFLQRPKRKFDDDENGRGRRRGRRRGGRNRNRNEDANSEAKTDVKAEDGAVTSEEAKSETVVDADTSNTQVETVESQVEPNAEGHETSGTDAETAIETVESQSTDTSETDAPVEPELDVKSENVDVTSGSEPDATSKNADTAEIDTSEQDKVSQS